MGKGLHLAFLVLAAAIASAEPLKKEVLNLPPLIHFSDVFNTHSDNEQEKLNEETIVPNWPNSPGHLEPGKPQPGWQQPLKPLSDWQQPGWQQPGWQQPGWQQPGWQQPGWQQPGWQQPGWQQPGWQQPGWQQPGWQQPGWQQPGWQQPGWPGFPEYPPQQGGIYWPIYPGYPAYPSYPPLPPYPPSSPRIQDVELVERYCKFNEDGSKEYKLVLSNGLVIYQKILNKNGNKQNIQLLEGYYSDKRDDNTYLTTYFRADENGYSASSETSDSPPGYPDIKEMISLPLQEDHKK